MSDLKQKLEQLLRFNDKIPRDLYLSLIHLLAIEIYDIPNLRELIFTIYKLLKIDNSHKDLLVKFVKAKVTRQIYKRIENKTHIADILHELIVFDTEVNPDNKDRGPFDYIK